MLDLAIDVILLTVFCMGFACGWICHGEQAREDKRRRQ